MRLTYFFTALLLLLMTACGFHLRGSRPQADVDALTSVYIEPGPSRATDLIRELKGQLKSADVRVASQSEEAEYRLTLSQVRVDRNVLSVSAQTGKAEEYELRMTLRMSVSRNEETLVDNELIEVARDYTFDEDAVLGKFSEEQVLEEEMTRLAVERIVRRLNAVAADG